MKNVILQIFREMWSKCFCFPVVEAEQHGKNQLDKPDAGHRASSLTKELEAYLLKRFDFRYNCLTGVTEFRPVGEPEFLFRPIDEREMNGMVIDARIQGFSCWRNDLPTLILSTRVESYNPFHLYMKELPCWDGRDRIVPLLKRVSENELWIQGGRYWLRAMVSQWMGKQRRYANTLTPILISDAQGLGKSTFCRQLLPDSLSAYYLDNLNLAAGSFPERKLVKNGLINLDEFDKISEKRQPDLKNLLQMLNVPVYRGKRLGYVMEPRLASFIATTNSRQILTDPTGSRRYLCVEVEREVSKESLEHKQLYAQLKLEVENGARDYMNSEEETVLQCHNRAFYKHSLLEDVFYACFRQADKEECNDRKGWFTAAEIFKAMHKHNPSALQGISAKQLSYKLVGMGLRARHTNHGNYYLVKRLMN